MATALDTGATPSTRAQRVAAPTLVAGAVLGASVLLHLRDPHESGSYLYCPWLLLTGTYCPGCGGLRAVNDLTRGDLAAAASSNLLFVGAIPLLVFFWVALVLRPLAGRTTNRQPAPPGSPGAPARGGLARVLGGAQPAGVRVARALTPYRPGSPARPRRRLTSQRRTTDASTPNG